MTMGYKARKRLALLVLLLGLPLWIAASVWLVSLFDRPSLWVEFLIYVGLGILWVLPLRRLFLGVGQPDPQAPNDEGAGRP
jgi:hypothetical protein